MRGVNPIFSDPEALEEKINRYFETMNREDNKAPPTLSGLALFLGVTRRTLSNYISDYETGAGKRGKGKAAQCGELLMIAKGQIETYLEEQLVSQRNTHGIEFALMNGFGWGAKETVDVKGGVHVEHSGEVATPISKLSDEELIEQMRILGVRQAEIMAREGISSGVDG